MNVNSCPICKQFNCLEERRFSLDGNEYTAIYCKKCNEIVASKDESFSRELERVKEIMAKICTNFPTIGDDNDNN